MTAHYDSVDTELELAIELSKQSYEEEIRRRGEFMHNRGDDLINWEDAEERNRQNKISYINSLIEAGQGWQNSNDQSSRCMSAAPSSQSLANVFQQPVASSSHDGRFPPNPLFTINQQRMLPQNDALSSSNVNFANQAYVNPTNSAVVVPFRSSANSQISNDDLIDLSEPQDQVTYSYEQLRDEFDPLCIKSTSKQSEDSSSISSNEKANTLQAPSLESNRSEGSDGPPQKPLRITKVADRRPFDWMKQQSIDLNEIILKNGICEVDLEIKSLLRRAPKTCNSISRQFISPVVDYLITSVKVTSVKLIVEKDYSWPTTMSVDDKIVFTCDTGITIEEILTDVLSTFLDSSQIGRMNGRIPIDEYGLKIYGLDEFLSNSSQLGENPFVGQALAFGNDIRLEVGRILQGSKTPTNRLDTSNIESIHHYFTQARNKKGNPLTVKLETINEIMDTLKKAANSYIKNFTNENGTCPKFKLVVVQTIKLMCTALGNIFTCDLSAALRSYNDSSTLDQILTASKRLFSALCNLIDIYCKSVRCNFKLVPLKSSDREQRELISVEEHLLVNVESVHNICVDWLQNYHSFFIAIHVMHGTEELCRGFKEAPRPVITDDMFNYCRTNAWAAFDLPLCVLPRETRIFILLYGVQYYSTNNEQNHPLVTAEVPCTYEKQLACASFPLFDHEGMFRQGSSLLPLTSITGPIVQPWGPRPLFETDDDLVALVTLPQFHFDVVFPYIEYGENSFKRDFNTLDSDNQQFLLDIVENGVTHSLSEDEKEILWDKRHYLTQIPAGLPLVLASAFQWDCASLTNIYQLIDDWMPLNSVQAVELLLPHFPDLTVREKAVSWLRTASSDFLFNFIPELVEALRFETFENSSLAVCLINLSAGDRRFAFELYWQLQQRIDQCSDRPYLRRSALLQNEILKLMDNEFQADIENQHRLLRVLNIIMADMKSADASKMLAVLRRHLSLLDARILENNVRLPILPSFLCTGIDVSDSNYFNSLTKPMKIAFKGLKRSFPVLYKVGDDMRQDALVLQLVKMMNDIWLSQGLDLKMIIFRCMPLGNKCGMVELVPECHTLCEIQSAGGAAGVFKDDVIKNWLEKHNPSEFQFKVALENFHLSCAGWCVATYVLGIGDRHNDNILVTKTGHVFHIDFGKYMGDWQMAAGFRRDRTPFIFTSDMAYVINEGSAQSSTSRYQHFVDNSCKAFNLLRRKYSLLVNLMKMMSCSDIPGMDMDAVNFVQNNLLLHLTETQATVQFTRMIEESLKSKFPRLNFFAHTLIQLKGSSIRGTSDDTTLSFIPHLHTMKEDGRILNVVVLAFEKWHVPEKVYMYKLEVRRENEAVSGIIYRSFSEFNELYVKLCRMYPITHLPSLSRSTNVGRSNIRSVAERRQADIQQFLTMLFDHHADIAHCDIVYTFFHIILRDSAPEESNRLSQLISESGKSSQQITGRISLRISYDMLESKLTVFVGHIKGLSSVNRQAPDSYVKMYLHPDLQRVSKKKTRVIKNTQMPTFNEEICYYLNDEMGIDHRALEVSVWNSCSLVGENSVIGTVHIALKKFNDVPANRKKVKVIDGWFPLLKYAPR